MQMNHGNKPGQKPGQQAAKPAETAGVFQLPVYVTHADIERDMESGKLTIKQGMKASADLTAKMVAAAKAAGSKDLRMQVGPKGGLQLLGGNLPQMGITQPWAIWQTIFGQMEAMKAFVALHDATDNDDAEPVAINVYKTVNGKDTIDKDAGKRLASWYPHAHSGKGETTLVYTGQRLMPDGEVVEE